MSGLLVLLRLRGRMLANRLRVASLGQRLKLVAVGGVTLAVLVVEGLAAAWVFGRLKMHEDLSEFFVLALVERLLGLVFLTSLSMLVLSNAITALQTLYLSRDLDLLVASPTRTLSVFASKFVESVALSSYMVVAFVLPILVGYGLAFDAGGLFYLQMLPALVVYVLAPAGLGVAVTVVVMRAVPARRAHQALTVLTLAGGVSLVVLLRLTRPERLIRPATREDLMEFLRAITLPAADYLPSSWAARLQMAAIGGDRDALWVNAALLLGAAAVGLALAWAAARWSYAVGLAGAHEGRPRGRGGEAVRPLGLVGRDLRLFFRDASQWSQVLLLGALVVVYVFNITALPAELLGGGRLQFRDIVAWLNGGLAALVLSALGLRFVLPSTSLEGGAFWAVVSSPVSKSRYVLGKVLFFLPLVVFAEALVLLANLVLGVGGYVMLLSAATAAVASLALIGLGVGLGAAFPVFKLENPAQILFSTGGVLYGVTALVYVVFVLVVEAPVVWRHMALGASHSRVDLAHYAVLLAVSLLVGGLPLLWGIRRLERLEV